MYEYVELDLRNLNEATKAAYEPLALPESKCCLSGRDRWGLELSILTAIGVTFNGIPIGLIIAGVMPSLKEAEIYSLYVDSDHRNRQVASQLLIRMKKKLSGMHIQRVLISYPSEGPTNLFLEKAIQCLGWSKSYPILVRCLFDVPNFHPDWYTKKYHYAAGFSSFPWKELTIQERDTLHHQGYEGRYPLYVTPFRKEHLVEEINSLGLRYCGEVIGWIITHRLNAATIQYKAFHMLKEHRHRGESVKLLTESIKLQQNSVVPWGELEVNVQSVSSNWLHFINHRLVPYAHTVTRIQQSSLFMM